MDFQVFITYVNSFIVVTGWWRKYSAFVILPMNKLSLGNPEGMDWRYESDNNKEALPSFFHALSTLPYRLLPNPRWELNDKSPFSRVRFINIIYSWLSGHSVAAEHQDTHSDAAETVRLVKTARSCHTVLSLLYSLGYHLSDFVQWQFLTHWWTLHVFLA